jgi:thiamine-monophosphate kinase
MSDAPELTTQTVEDIGEFELIERLARFFSGSAAVVGVGDDAAVLDLGGADYVLASVDMMVQDVHFELRDADPGIIGRRAIASNVSDIAAMGGEPTFALTSLALPGTCPVDFVDRLYEGLIHEARLTGTGIVGGNITRTSGPICIDVTILGRVPKAEVVLRSGARPGDVLAVTGTLGGATADRLIRLSSREDKPFRASWTTGQYPIPIPRVAVARRLAERRLPQAMLDLSDGLAGDIRHLCRASKVGAVIYEDRLPISSRTRAIAEDLGVTPVSLALSGGEDYELLMAFSSDDLAAAHEAAGDVPLTVIGDVVAAIGAVTLVAESGDHRELPPSGWSHF